jgi:polysaccharide biosynthesis protein PelG
LAGIGFSLRALAKDRSFTGLVRYYGAASMLSSGPWLVSIFALMFVGFVGHAIGAAPAAVTRFQVAVTWMFAFSLLLASPLTLYLTRFVSDLMYARREALVFPTLVGALSVMSVVAGGFGLALSPAFDDASLLVRVLLCLGFVLLCDIWLAVVVLSGLREHQRVTRSFALGYAVTLGGSALFGRHGEEGLLTAFVLGHAVLLGRALAHVAERLPAQLRVSWTLFKVRQRYENLIVIGLVSTLATWLDKLMFWLHPLTSHGVLGPLRASEVYDLPLFLAYLLIVPGMSVFLVRIETDYAEVHAAFFEAVEAGATLRRLESLHAELVQAARRALNAIFKAQAITFAVSAAAGRELLSAFGLSQLHYPLFLIDAAGVSMQVFLLAAMSLLFYLDRRSLVLRLSLVLCVLSGLGTWLSLRLGAAYYGYGFAAAVTLTSVIAVALLDRVFRKLVRDTFMRTEPSW